MHPPPHTLPSQTIRLTLLLPLPALTPCQLVNQGPSAVNKRRKIWFITRRVVFSPRLFIWYIISVASCLVASCLRRFSSWLLWPSLSGIQQEEMVHVFCSQLLFIVVIVIWLMYACIHIHMGLEAELTGSLWSYREEKRGQSFVFDRDEYIIFPLFFP